VVLGADRLIRARRPERPADASELVPGFHPETPLETALACQPELLAGLAWGKPRPGHPEGPVGHHVADLLRQIDATERDPERRSALRFIALVHDSFKYQVNHRRPRTGENHHAMRARRFAERFVSDERLLTTIELHDRPYHLWKRLNRTGRLQKDRLERMLARIPDHELFLRFVEIDGSSEAKDQKPVRWFRDLLRERGLVGWPQP
jgi:hypothetical protein